MQGCKIAIRVKTAMLLICVGWLSVNLLIRISCVLFCCRTYQYVTRELPLVPYHIPIIVLVGSPYSIPHCLNGCYTMLGQLQRHGRTSGGQ